MKNAQEQFDRAALAAVLVEKAELLIRQARREMSHVDGMGVPCHTILCHLERTIREASYNVAAVVGQKRRNARRAKSLLFAEC